MSPCDFNETDATALSGAECAGVLTRLEASVTLRRGATRAGADGQLQDGWGVALNSSPEGAPPRERLHEVAEVARASLKRYQRRYAHMALAPLHIKRQRPDGSREPLSAAGGAAIDDAHLSGLIARAFRPGGIKRQKCEADVGGYPYSHGEESPLMPRSEAPHRMLPWTSALNDHFDAGKTEFLYQERTITPRTGQLLIAPGGVTRTHRGNRPRGGHNYIATSWFLDLRAEQVSAQ